MKDPFNKLAHMLRTPAAVLLALEQKMNALTGQEGVFEDILHENDVTVARTLEGLGVSSTDNPRTVRAALSERLKHLDKHLYELLGRPDLAKPIEACQKLCEMVDKVFVPPTGLFIKQDRGASLLEKYPPHNLLQHFGYANVRELLDKEGFASIMSSLRFTQSERWMHQFFDVSYRDLKPDDFEERSVEHIILDTKWLAVSEKFLEKKHHNVSHLKEFGIIFVVPTPLDMPGEMMRLFTLILHYLHEVPFYSDLFRNFMLGDDFGHKFRSVLRGDVPPGQMSNHGKIVWRVVQRYLTKNNPDDFRLFEPHVSPEADHWWHAEEDLGRLSRILGKDRGELDLGWWSGLDFVGDLFNDPTTGQPELVSLDLIDLLMSLVHADHGKYLYHQQEALWNKIFIEYMGRDKMEELIKEHIIDGFIVLGEIT